jgi:S-(hydroxymethyl)glutathione dehydrogenase/alcohol dehydrogenase
MRRPVERVDTMKAAVLNTFSGKFEIEDLEIGKPTHREVLVEVKAWGLRHSNLHLAEANFGTVLLIRAI